ncbi:DUF4184 family protein [Nocardioides marinquilinus]|uniref:DUF4184 family protein n=1 Tax=Nocardioides marinquilinus TaxID=1210400 RepID=A0ABP9PYT6_9ACTN
MPVTFAHPAAVLLLRWTPLPLAAMVVGSMAPDLPLFLRWQAGYRVTHDPLGVVTVDVLVGLALLLAWTTCLRGALLDVSPQWVRARVDPQHRLSPTAWALAPLGLALGAATHVVWDAFTHRNRWGTRSVDWLVAEHAGMAGHRWAQYGSGVVGLTVLGVVVWLTLRGRRPHEPAPRLLPEWTSSALVGLAVVGGLVGAVRHLDTDPWHVGMFAVIGAGQLTAVGLAVAGAAWWTASRRVGSAVG